MTPITDEWRVVMRLDIFVLLAPTCSALMLLSDQ